VIFWFVDWLTSFGISVPTVFTYSSTRMALAAVTSLLVCILCGPRFITLLYQLKMGQPIRKEECPLLGRLHEKKEDTPTMGGLLILASMLLSMFLYMEWTSANTLLLLVTTVWLGGIGARDDYLKLRKRNSKGLSGRKKLLGQALLSALLAIYLLSPTVAEAIHFGDWWAPTTAREWLSDGSARTLLLHDYAVRLYLPFLKSFWFAFVGIGVLAYAFFLFFVVTGTSNAVNLTDGLDGLAAGALLMVASSFALIAFITNHAQVANYLNILYINESSEIAVYLSALAGACLGFLWYNGYPAQVFMGDTGSLALGGIIGVSAILLKRELLLAIIGGLFVMEALSVMMQVASYKWRNRRRIFLCTPLHHHFEYVGWPETKVVVRFWIVGLLLAIVGVASLKFQ
jgi:phospho-N-acetylmuramoyl-pentapeptide-transferase